MLARTIGCTRRRALGMALVATPLLSARARSAGVGFAGFLASVRSEAERRGIASATISAAFAGLSPDPKVIELDRHQPEFTETWAQYSAAVLSADRISQGRSLYATNRALLARVTGTYPAAAAIIMGIWGLESNYGAYQGGFSVLRSLATLAFATTRGGYFRSELIAALEILSHGDVSPGGMVGSWAGAMGQPQFMPSAYLTYAVDFDRTGRRNIWTDTADVLASIANYLMRNGWRAGEPWGRQVLPPPRFPAGLAADGAARTVQAWSTLGFRGLDGRPLEAASTRARLLLPAGPAGPAYLAFPNF
ncbi:MAG: lytic murein transglycosylase, partial [Acetobacteraceae bacterium]